MISEFLLRQYVTLVSPPKKRRTQSPADYFGGQFDTSPALFGLIQNLDLKDKRVLEIGCGTGGRSTWLAKNGPVEVVAIDINGAEIELARELARKHSPELKNLTFVHTQEDIKLDIADFDIVLLVDSLEHVHSPYKALKLAYSYTRPGGRAYFTTFGWYHHRGSHTGFPFVNLLFSDETILNVIRWRVSHPDYQPSMWDTNPPIARWKGLYDLRDRPGEYLNKITIGQMKKLIRYSDFRVGKLNVLGFRNPKFRWLNLLCGIPVIQEAVHSYVVGELIK